MLFILCFVYTVFYSGLYLYCVATYWFNPSLYCIIYIITSLYTSPSVRPVERFGDSFLYDVAITPYCHYIRVRVRMSNLWAWAFSPVGHDLFTFLLYDSILYYTILYYTTLYYTTIFCISQYYFSFSPGYVWFSREAKAVKLSLIKIFIKIIPFYRVFLCRFLSSAKVQPICQFHKSKRYEKSCIY